MEFEPANWNVVIAGAWNRAILTPQWIGQSIFKVAEGTPLPLEVPLNVRGPWKVKHDDCSVLVSANRLEIVADSLDFGTLEKARVFGVAAIEELPKTPLVAAGFNVRYTSEDDLDPDLGALVQCDIDTRISACGLEINRRSAERSLSFEGGQLNLSVVFGDSETNIDFNFNKSSGNSEHLKEWLALPIERIREVTESIIEKIGITV